MDEKTAQVWRSDLEQKLADAKSSDLLIPYPQVAVAFPSSRPHPDTFDHNCIDDESLKAWTEERGWEVSTAPEKASDQNTLRPPIRFQKIPGK